MEASSADVGIHAIEIYFPRQYVDQGDLEKYDGVGAGKYTIGLGQTRMSFCDDREDINSIALTTLTSLIRKYSIDLSSIGRLEVGTETVLDKSKSCKSVLMQLFEAAGNTDVEGIDNLNACYGGTNAIFNSVSWLQSAAWDGRNAIVVAGDIALYDQVNARPTGGVGCVAMLIGPNAPLVVEPARGTCIKHVYDFYKPNFKSEYPYVDGQLSIRCYLDALDASYNAYLAKRARVDKRLQLTAANGSSEGSAGPNSNHQDQHTNGSINGHHHQQQTHAPPPPPDQDTPPSTPENTTTTLPLDTFDFLIFHSPTCKLVTKAHARLLYLSFLSNPTHAAFASLSRPDRSHLLALDHQASLTDKTLEKTFLALAKERFQARVQPSVNVPTMCGNMYCASVYGALVSLLCGGDSNALIGKRIGVYSYGGGLAASFFSLRIRASVDAMVKKLDLQRRLDSRAGVSVEEYLEACRLRENTYGQKGYQPKGEIAKLAPGTYYLTEVNDTYHRSYAVKE
ncbi:MAG: hypothetical protein Q9207_005684 [Kuettlingeria erythrocarpa]